MQKCFATQCLLQVLKAGRILRVRGPSWTPANSCNSVFDKYWATKVYRHFWYKKRVLCSFFFHFFLIKTNYLRSNILRRHFYIHYYRFKLAWSTQQASSIHFRYQASLLRIHGYFGPVYLLQVNKNDDEECCFLKLFGLNINPFFNFSESCFPLCGCRNWGWDPKQERQENFSCLWF